MIQSDFDLLYIGFLFQNHGQRPSRSDDHA